MAATTTTLMIARIRLLAALEGVVRGMIGKASSGALGGMLPFA